jgi:DoxX-like family
MATKSIWAGRVLSGLVIAFLLLDGAMKLVPAEVVLDTMKQLGWPSDISTARMLGLLTLVSAALYAIPRTAMLGAVLATAYLGGAVATHVRIGSPLFSHVLFGVYLGVMLWGGLWLRDPRVRAMIPFMTVPPSGT